MTLVVDDPPILLVTGVANDTVRRFWQDWSDWGSDWNKKTYNWSSKRPEKRLLPIQEKKNEDVNGAVGAGGVVAAWDALKIWDHCSVCEFLAGVESALPLADGHQWRNFDLT